MADVVERYENPALALGRATERADYRPARCRWAGRSRAEPLGAFWQAARSPAGSWCRQNLMAWAAGLAGEERRAES